MVSSVPKGAPLFRFDRREQTLRQRLLPATQQGVASLEFQAATAAEHLGPLLRRNLPDVLHIVCHGTDTPAGPALSFEDRCGERKPVTAADLDALLAKLKTRRPALVVLEACSSRPIGDALVAASGGCVVAMEGKADPGAGTRFFSSFYQALAAGRCVGDAFAGARRDLELLCALAVGTPLLLGDTKTIDARLEELPRPAPRGIDLAAVAQHVFRSTAHGPAQLDFRGRSEELAWLTEALEPERRGAPVLLRGPAGVGKTELLQRWLDSQHELGWFGFSRVFTWSFDSAQRGRGCGDIHAFLEEALFFFGDLERSMEARDPTPKAYIRGLRLGRLLRDEPVLLVLDSVPLLPRGSGAPRTGLESLLHPALGALLRESAGGSAAFVLAIQSKGDKPTRGCETLDLGGLDDAVGADLLWSRGLVDTPEELEGLSASLRGEPLALDLCARSFATAGQAREALAAATVSADASPLTRLLAAVSVEMDAASREHLDLLALEEGTLGVERRRTDAEDADPSAIPRQDSSSEAQGGRLGNEATRYALLRPLARAGILRVDRDSLTAKFSHPVLIDAALRLPRDRSRYAAVLDHALEGQEHARDLADVRRLAGVVSLARKIGEYARARDIYKELICRAEPKGQEQSLVARTLGAIAEDLEILVGFFAVDKDRTPRWDRLTGGGEDVAAAFVFHRLALALRHLGRTDEAVAPMQCALSGYQARGDWERAATCANDLAELQAFCGDLGAALVAARDAVKASQASGDRITPFLTRATLGHVQHLLGDLGDARQSFEEAERGVAGTNAPFLFSRPGFQYWSFLLDELERSWRAERTLDEAALKQLRERLAAARDSHGDTSIAPVSLALDALAAGRLATLELEIGVSQEKDTQKVRIDAMRNLGLAVSTFRSRHHLWMLPQALRARARMRRLLQDPINASLDLDEAEDLARGHQLPPDIVACHLERASLHLSMGRIAAGRKQLGQARKALDATEREGPARRCHRLMDRANFVEEELASTAADLEESAREQNRPTP